MLRPYAHSRRTARLCLVQSRSFRPLTFGLRSALNRASEKGGPLHFRVEKIAGLAENPHKECIKNRCTLHK